MKAKVYVTRRIPQAGIDILRESCSSVEVNEEDRVLTHEELQGKVGGCDGVLCLLTDKIDLAVLNAATRAVGFANYAVGFDNIDVAEATKRGILVSNTPGVLTNATADHAWALLFSLARRIVESDAYTRAGKFKGWGPMLFLGGDITGRTLGIIGAGRIGTAVALRSAGFSMRVLYADERRNEDLEKKVGARRAPLPELLAESDFVSVHVNLSAETRHLIGKRELGMMKKSAYLINTSRGPVVDEKALVEALRERKIGGAGLDVYEEEPALAPGLASLPNAVVVPHIASATIETRTRMATMAATNLVQMLRGERPTNLVNEEALAKRRKLG
ncbi:MAG: D-glycerate dehydrogenase [Planctomycetota bacterium]